MYMIGKKHTKNENTLLIYIILSMILLSITLIVNVFFKDNIEIDYLSSTLQFIKLFNVIISILGVVSCLVSYNRSKYNDMFITSLMYIGLAVGILFGQIDYLPFYHDELKLSTYIVVSSSLLRIFLLTLSVLPENKLKNKINNNKLISVLITIFLTIILGTFERKITTIYSSQYSNNFLIVYNIFLIIIYTTCSIKLLTRALKKNEYMFVVLSSSIFILAIKAAYAIYISNKLTFYTKLISVSLTYICFFIIIIGALIELFMYISRTNALNDRLRIFHSLAENNNHSFTLIFDEDTNLFYVNDKVKEYYECNNDINKLELIFKEKINSIDKQRDIIEALELNNSWRGIIKSRKYDKTIDCCVQPINLAKNKKYIAVTYIDITEAVKNELEVEKLRLYDKEKSEFIANISHELKTPLNLFYSSIQLLDKFIEIDEIDFKLIYKKYNKVLHTNCDRMTRLVNNIMDLSKIDIGVLKADFKNYNIISIVEDVTLSVVEYASLKNINIQFDTDEEEQIIKCDAYMIERVMLNLLSNAIKFSSENANIFVNILTNKKWIEINVTDEGIGISKENQNIIFNKFVQIDKSFTRANEGSGIGLSIVQSIINLHEGIINVESELNKGTVFRIVLPNKCIENKSSTIYNVDNYKVKLELSDIYEVSI
ncbi:sensor histidine kinase [Romboutsia sp. 1001713B170207_170306_H8]|uniref:sensor histidine kinase n=2 Tax=unclassified Romboutsia TaxID=2626894 RepID=UPI001897106C|nr:HAMP domain-containing sensor histidine kinase [Romboutsia sp. 1001713B170207_170306_H8]